MSNHRGSYSSLIVALLSLHCAIATVANCVIVDGEKKKEISPTKNQSEEKTMIDSFNTKTCGISDPNFDEHEFINMAREGQFPWIVSFQVNIPDKSTQSNRTKDVHFCCGSFISDKWILSSAHCFESR